MKRQCILSCVIVLLRRRGAYVSRKEIATKTVFYFRRRNAKHRKSVGIAYLLWFFFGSFGIHKFYLGDTKKGLLYLVLGIFGWISIFTGGLAALGGSNGGGFFAIIGLICIVVLGIMLLIDLFTIPGQIKSAEEKAEEQIVNNLLSMNTATSSGLGDDGQ